MKVAGRLPDLFAEVRQDEVSSAWMLGLNLLLSLTQAQEKGRIRRLRAFALSRSKMGSPQC